MKTHLVIGGCGFLGRHVVRSLMERGDTVRVVDMVDWPDGAERSPETVITDLSDAGVSQFSNIIGNFDVVHHYAWSTIPQTANADPVSDLQINLGITVRLLEALQGRGGGTIIFPSSGGTVYGRLQQIPVPESHPLLPIAAHGASKAAAEMYLNVFRDLYGIDARIARIANPFGAGQNPNRPQGVASTIAFRALARKTVEIWGSGNVVRDFIHVNDAAAGLLAICDAPVVNMRILPLYNIGSGKGASVNEILATVERYVGNPIEVIRKPERPFDVAISVLDISRAIAELGWHPKFDMDRGIRQMIADLRDNPMRQFSSPG
jgi:UDP-glucose 4-epimerase